MVGIAAFALGSFRADEYEATAKVAFLEDTRFDYADAERDRLVGFVADFADEQVASTPGLSSISYLRPSRETFLDVTANASSPEVAQSAANEIANTMVSADLAARRERIANDIAARGRLIESIDQEMSTLAASIADSASREAFAQATRFESDPETLERLTIELREAQSDLFFERRRRNAIAAKRDEIVDQITTMTADSEFLNQPIAVVQPASLPSLPTNPTPATIALIAVSVAFVLVMFALLLWAPVARVSSVSPVAALPYASDDAEADPWAA